MTRENSVCIHFRQFVNHGTIPPELIQEFKRNPVNYVLTTQDPKVANVIRNMRMAKEKVFSLKDDYGTKTLWEEIRRQSDGKVLRPSENIYTFKFELDQAANLRYYTYMRSGQNPEKVPNLRVGYHWWLQGVSEP